MPNPRGTNQYTGGSETRKHWWVFAAGVALGIVIGALATARILYSVAS